MSNLSHSVMTFLNGASGSHQSPDAMGENGTIGEEMDALSSAMYMMSRTRLERTLKPLVHTMNAQLRRDASHAALWTSLRFDTQGAVAGMATGMYTQGATQLRSVRYGLSKYMSPSLQASAETITLAAMRTHTVMRSAALLVEHGRIRKLRDDGYSLMKRHIELGSGLRSLSDTLSQTARADISLAASTELSKKTHDLNMRKIAWEEKKQMRALKDAESDAMGSLFGDFLGGLADGFKFGG